MARVQPSATGAVLARAVQMLANGHDVISLAAGEPDFDTPEHIRSAAIQAIHAGETRYTPTDGTAALKAAIKAKFARDNRLAFEAAEIIVSSGAKQSLYNLCVAILDPGDELVVPAPCWVSYPDMARLAGAEAVLVPTALENGFRMTPQQLRAALTPESRLLVLNSPCNPTGTAYGRDELIAFGEVLRDFPRVVIAADDIYEHIYWRTEPFASMATVCPWLADRTVTINGVSKAYAMTGWRIGYAAGPATIIAAMNTVQSQSTTNPSSISQAAAVAALNGPQDAVAEMCATYRRRHDWLVEALNSLPGVRCVPGDGSFYAFARVQDAVEALGLTDDTALAAHLLDSAGVAVVPGSAFAAPGHLRFSFAASIRKLEAAVERLQSALLA